jgi:RNA polymerase sigma-70 factor (ECF subfamily)
MEGYTYEEIARITDSSLGTVKSRINRARQTLRNIMVEEFRIQNPESRIGKRN